MKPKLVNRDAGFTLIEVLISLAIFSIGILAVASMQYWSVHNTTAGNVLTQATNLARAKMEDMKNASNITALTNGSDATSLDEDGNAGGIFTRSWVVTNPLGGSTSRQIQVNVNWSRLGQNRSVVLTTISRGNGT
jgi:type IV pilus assembly protein PilV